MQLDKTKKYLLGVSGGSDSMMLLSLCVKSKLDIVVCHVNYKKRANADKEEKLVLDYCAKNNVSVFVKYPVQDNKENFESWAREARYQFYKEVYQTNNCDALLLGHQMDDHIETYLMALERGSRGWYYGILRNTYHHNMNIIRPLLDIRKADTISYCVNNNVEYLDDESNFSLDYSRNRIRHNVVEKADKVQIEKWLNEIEKLNNKTKEQLDYFQQQYNNDYIDIDKYSLENGKTRKLLLRWYIYKYYNKEVLSNDYLRELDNIIIRGKKNTNFLFKDDIQFVKEYGRFYLCNLDKGFSFTFKKLEYTKTEYFELKNSGKIIESLTLSDSDYPIVIRNAKENDEIELRLGHKKVNRFFIDRKIPYKDRANWLVIENKDGKVIFVKGVGCDIYHFTTKPNVFIV